ncbi:hypothetical protein HK414_03125 [Ramlibacter terrae]|uniref:Uncharacterized protein n=1 Tax=Ramlibacter terrae TaxID=2732511 RepID=A0ABX6P1N9_9BURK|nr:hypothetical protein HK414_03125 [Ramlibacter terrae]
MADDAIVESAAGLADAGGEVAHGAGREAFALQQREPGDAGAIAADARVVEDGEQRTGGAGEAGRTQPAVRAGDGEATGVRRAEFGDRIDEADRQVSRRRRRPP